MSYSPVKLLIVLMLLSLSVCSIAAEGSLEDLLKKTESTTAPMAVPVSVPQIATNASQPPKTEQPKLHGPEKVKLGADETLPVIVREAKEPARMKTDSSVIEKTVGADEIIEASVVSEESPTNTLTQFGYNYFQNLSLLPQIDIQVNADYLVGPGDSIVVTVWGSIDGSYDLSVNSAGEVVLPKVGPVRVAGLPFGKLPEVFRVHLSKVFRDFNLAVNMGKLRTNKISVIGEVSSPGDYTVSSLATVLNALSAAGGPTKNGSLRNITIRRTGKAEENIDLYDFFLTGDKRKDVRLSSGDTIFVPVIGRIASVTGKVKRPAIYELKKESTLKDLLALAEGISSTGYLQRVQISRVVANQNKQVIDLNLEAGLTGKTFDQLSADIAIQDMDIVKIFPINRLLRNHFKLEGHLERPGFYALKPGIRISSVVNYQLLLPEYAPIIEVTRLYPPNLEPRKILLDLEKALAKDPGQDLEIQEFDTIRLFSKWKLQEKMHVRVSGEVQVPGVYPLFTGMTVRDLLIQAGNPKSSAYMKSAELKRLDFSGVNITPSSSYFNLEEVLNGVSKDNMELKPFDEVVVKKWFAKEDQQVFISGEVRNPGSFRYITGMTVRDLVIEAGNVKKTAYLKNAEITRQKIEGDTVRTYPVLVNLEEGLSGKPINNVPLEPFDVVVIRKIPYWTEETERYATIGGEVMFPGMYPVYRGERLSKLIERAGGFTDKAYLRGVKFTREATRQLQQQRMDEALAKVQEKISTLQAKSAQTAVSKEEADGIKSAAEGLTRSVESLKTKKAEGRMVVKLDSLSDLKAGFYDLELQAGDIFAVPKDPGGINILGDVYNQTSIVSQPSENVEWYLDQVGGATVEADLGETYVVKVDGTVISQKNSFSFMFYNAFWSKALDSGDTVVVPRKLEANAWLRDIKDITTIISQLAITAGTVFLGLR